MTITFERRVQHITFQSATAPGITWTTAIGSSRTSDDRLLSVALVIGVSIPFDMDSLFDLLVTYGGLAPDAVPAAGALVALRNQDDEENNGLWIVSDDEAGLIDRRDWRASEEDRIVIASEVWGSSLLTGGDPVEGELFMVRGGALEFFPVDDDSPAGIDLAGLRGGLAPAMIGGATTSHAWTMPAWGTLTTGLEILFDVTVPPWGEPFPEILSQLFVMPDDGRDNFELSFRSEGGIYPPPDATEVDGATALFWQQTLQGGTIESTVQPSIRLEGARPGDRIVGLLTNTFETETLRIALRVATGGDFEKHDERWVTIYEESDPSFASINSGSLAVMVGNRLGAPAFRVAAWDGDTLLMDFDPSRMDPGTATQPDPELEWPWSTVSGRLGWAPNLPILDGTYAWQGPTTGGGSGDVVGPSSSIDGRPVLWDGTTGKLLKVGATNTANGLVKLDDDATIPDILIPASIARDSEVTSAVNAAVAALVASAPSVLDTLDELAAALGDDANFAATVTTALASKGGVRAARYWGTAVDGDQTISGTTVLPAPLHCHNLHVTGTLYTANFPVYVTGTLSGNGTINGDGTSATTNSGPAAWGTGTLGASAAGTAGATGAGSQASALTNRLGGAGGAGGNGSSGAGGAAQTNTVPTAAKGSGKIIVEAFRLGILPGAGTGTPAGGIGGSGAGGDSTNAGGGGGAGGTLVHIAAKTISFTGTISAKGGNGANRSTGNVGGGGGGGGGVIVVETDSTTQTFTTDVSGGTGGTKAGTGTNGSNGSAGTAIVLLGA